MALYGGDAGRDKIMVGGMTWQRIISGVDYHAQTGCSEIQLEQDGDSFRACRVWRGFGRIVIAGPSNDRDAIELEALRTVTPHATLEDHLAWREHQKIRPPWVCI